MALGGGDLAVVYGINFMKKYGFTLIDLIVSIAIFGLITASVLVNFRAGSRGDSVRQSANITATMLRRAQTMTLSGELLLDESFPIGGYGIYFDSADPDTLTLFADIDGNYVYDAGEEIDTEDLAGDAYFSAGGNLGVVFSSPDSDVYFNGLATDPLKQITIAASDTDVTQSIYVYRVSGQIRVE